MTQSLLFVCLGNICRSPLAAAIARKRADELGLSLRIDSAGIGGWHLGQGADARAVVAARVNGIELDGHVARKLTAEDLEAFDLILIADQEVYNHVATMAPERLMSKIAYLASFGQAADTAGTLDIPDPYYTGRFDPVIAQLEDCVAGVLRHATAEQ